jgi:hypothetical protein
MVDEKLYKANFILKQVHFFGFLYGLFSKGVSSYLQLSKKKISKNFIYKLIKKQPKCDIKPFFEVNLEDFFATAMI